ncbi:MAG TPA: 4Fe-4S dicluster domain-containing protein, partial [Verrucomicrobiae bacterium]|nr:4Fe-4S dicluster domain-containing protein [Verrucomicrobiae bacterium]
MTIAELIMDASEEAVGYTSDECLKCNVCLTVCPVARVTDLFPGPKYVGPQAQRFRTGRAQPVQVAGMPIPQSPDVTVDYCSGCGWCTTACPAGVKIAEMNSQSRARMKAGKRPKLRDWGLGQTDLV